MKRECGERSEACSAQSNLRKATTSEKRSSGFSTQKECQISILIWTEWSVLLPPEKSAAPRLSAAAA